MILLKHGILAFSDTRPHIPRHNWLGFLSKRSLWCTCTLNVKLMLVNDLVRLKTTE
jgi:hypothetical protein